MSDNDTLPPKAVQKFMFDRNKFDADEPNDVAEEENAPPPPPTFDQEELLKARKDAYEEGRKEGTKEALGRIEKDISTTLDTIRDHFDLLFRAEALRYNTFEEEAVQLAHAIFKHCFPSLNEQNGLNDVKTMIENVLETVRDMPEVVIELPESYVDPIKTHIDTILRDKGLGARCTVRSHPSLNAGQCRMGWANGTAVRDPQHLAEKIATQIEQVLADRANLTDNKTEHHQNAPVSVTDEAAPHTDEPDRGDPA